MVSPALRRSISSELRFAASPSMTTVALLPDAKGWMSRGACLTETPVKVIFE